MPWIIGLICFALVLWGLGFLAVGLSGFICDLLAQFGNLSPWPEFAPWFAFLSLFFCLRVVLLPLQFNHTRVNWKTGKRSTSFGETAGLKDLAIATLEGFTLFVLARAVTAGSLPWRVPYGVSWFWKVVFLAVVLIADMIVAFGWVVATTKLFKKLLAWVEGKPVGKLEGEFFGVRKDDDQSLGILIADILVYAPVFIVILVIYHSCPLLMPMLVSHVLLRSFFHGVINFGSLLMDWANTGRATGVTRTKKATAGP